MTTDKLNQEVVEETNTAVVEESNNEMEANEALTDEGTKDPKLSNKAWVLVGTVVATVVGVATAEGAKLRKAKKEPKEPKAKKGGWGLRNPFYRKETVAEKVEGVIEDAAEVVEETTEEIKEQVKQISKKDKK